MESAPVIDSILEINHKEAFSDLQTSVNVESAALVSKSSVAMMKASDENSDSSDTIGRSASSAPLSDYKSEDESENKPKFIEAPLPKVNPWTVNRNAAQVITGVTMKPVLRNQGNAFLSNFSLVKVKPTVS